MVLRDELNGYLDRLYDFGQIEDYCENGLQVEGKAEIGRMVFAVSFNQHLVAQAIEKGADALIVHHGIFDKGFFVLKGRRKKVVKRLLDHDISLFGIHLPMDIHPELGHNAQLLKILDAGDVEPFELGFTGMNVQGHSLDRILEIYHDLLHTGPVVDRSFDDPYFSMAEKKGFTVLENGPKIPEKIAVITGGSSSFYEKAVDLGVDTFISGEIKEKVPAISRETGTNYVNLGHYYSEKPGVLALEKRIRENFSVDTLYIEIPNPV